MPCRDLRVLLARRGATARQDHLRATHTRSTGLNSSGAKLNRLSPCPSCRAGPALARPSGGFRFRSNGGKGVRHVWCYTNLENRVEMPNWSVLIPIPIPLEHCCHWSRSVTADAKSFTFATNARHRLNRCQCEIYMVNAGRMSLGLDVGSAFLLPSLKFGAAATFGFLTTMRQSREKATHLLSHCSTSSQAQVGGHFLARPASDRFIRVEVRNSPGTCARHDLLEAYYKEDSYGGYREGAGQKADWNRQVKGLEQGGQPHRRYKTGRPYL